MLNIVHVTHEAVYKVGGIGTVLEGLINSRPYRDAVARTVLVCPLFYPENAQRLGAGGLVEYSSLDQVFESPFTDELRAVEREFNVRIVYGARPIEDEATARRTLCEVLLVDLRGIHRHRVNELKGQLWEHYGLQSHRYEHIWEFDQYVQVAAPAAAALRALRVATDAQPAVVFAHEFMGVPTALALTRAEPRQYRAIFHAHEIATVRRIVETHPGHDCTFYGALEAASGNRLYLDDVFGPQHDFFKAAVVDTTRYCDATLAVGHHVVRELQFQLRDLDDAEISLAYNGVPAVRCKPGVRAASRERLLDYAAALLGWRPSWVFTHVTRLAVSKALWRDLDVLAVLDEEFVRRGQTAALLILSTELPRRPVHDIAYMEREWGWPLAHREGPPDLTVGEARFYQQVQAFNLRARNIRAVFVNQFGFNRACCGSHVPLEAEFLDLRRGTDLEFGLSVYEPFGISPLEPLTFGGICVVSTSCGCAGFARQILGESRSPNVVFADYIGAAGRPESIRQALALDEDGRREIERRVATEVAAEILERLPTSPEQAAQLLTAGYELARRMSWDTVAERFIFPTIRRALSRRRILTLSSDVRKLA